MNVVLAPRGLEGQDELRLEKWVWVESLSCQSLPSVDFILLNVGDTQKVNHCVS